MKKLILSVVIMASMVMAANAVAYMRVKTTDGSVDEYHVENVEEVCYEETTGDQEVTVSGSVGNYTYVDLGLPSGTKWATYNVGATKPTEIGDYFAWGETMPKADYTWSTYKWGMVDAEGYFDKLTKYNENSNCGTVDDKKVLEPADDAVTANWGSAWRMPTRAEQDELREGCDWEWVEDFMGSGVNGQLGTSKANGNTIFLPAAGLLIGTGLDGAADNGYYWSSSLGGYLSNGAYGFRFHDGYVAWGNYYRSYGQSVRAVAK